MIKEMVFLLQQILLQTQIRNLHIPLNDYHQVLNTNWVNQCKVKISILTNQVRATEILDLKWSLKNKLTEIILLKLKPAQEEMEIKILKRGTKELEL